MIDNDLLIAFNDARLLLETLSECYDNSNSDILALPLSTTIRLWVHDTHHSKSILEHVGKKEIYFLSTNSNIREYPIHLGLVRQINVGVKDGVGGEAKYWAHSDERYFPDRTEYKKINFNMWWEEEIIMASCHHTLSRKDLVLAVANKDGGAHYDSQVESKYDTFRKSWSGGSTLVGIKSGALRGYDNIPTRPSVRQVAHELMLSIKDIQV